LTKQPKTIKLWAGVETTILMVINFIELEIRNPGIKTWDKILARILSLVLNQCLGSRVGGFMLGPKENLYGPPFMVWSDIEFVFGLHNSMRKIEDVRAIITLRNEKSCDDPKKYPRKLFGVVIYPDDFIVLLYYFFLVIIICYKIIKIVFL